jgi:excisionase family DNA binding protein
MKQQDSIKQLNSNIEQLLQHEDRPLTFPEACQYLGVSKSHLYKLVFLNKITHYKPAGKLLYFTKRDLNLYLFRGRRASEMELEQKAVDHVLQTV